MIFGLDAWMLDLSAKLVVTCGEVWPSTANFGRNCEESKTQNFSGIGRHYFQAKSGKGYRRRTESLQHVAADPAHCGLVDL